MGMMMAVVLGLALGAVGLANGVARINCDPATAQSALSA
jgi:hypothetical protein